MTEAWCELWIARLAEFTEHQAALERVLLPHENAHVRRLREGQATARASRGLLRLVLAQYLERAPAEIEINRNCPDCGRSHGRPRLGQGWGHDAEAIQFSVSHGGDLLVFAFVGVGPVGVDVEPIGVVENLDADLLDFTLTVAERERLLRMPRAEREREFLRHWTAKEAALKALGTGLDVDPQDVALAPVRPQDSSWGRASVRLPHRSATELWFRDVDVGPAHVCTLVTGQEVGDARLAGLSPSILPKDRG